MSKRYWAEPAPPVDGEPAWFGRYSSKSGFDRYTVRNANGDKISYQTKDAAEIAACEAFYTEFIDSYL